MGNVHGRYRCSADPGCTATGATESRSGAWAAPARRVLSVRSVTGPATLGTGTWPRQTFAGVDDIGLRAACELLQDVVLGLLERTGAGELAQLRVSKRELARRAGVQS